jgi:hypothetical protein
MPPINWSQFSIKTRRQLIDKPQGAEDDIEDDEELCCTIDELDDDDCHSDLFDMTKDEDNESLNALDNADDVINELESLLEEREEVNSLSTHLPSSVLLHTPTSDKGDWFEQSVKKLSTSALTQLSSDLTRAIVDHNSALRHELTMNEQLKVENQLSRDFISLTLSIERKQKQSVYHCNLSEDDDDDDEDIGETMQPPESTYLSTVIPYRPSDGRPTVEHLQIYLNLLSAIDEDSPTVPRLLTDYILKVLCPAN